MRFQLGSRLREVIAIVLGSLALGGFLVSYNQPQYSPIPLAQFVTYVAIVLAGASIGMISPTLKRTVLSVAILSVLSGATLFGFLLIPTLSGTVTQGTETLVTGALQKAAIGAAITLPVAFIGSFITSSIGD